MKVELSDKFVSQYQGGNISDLVESLLESHFNPDNDLFSKCWSRHKLELDIFLNINSSSKRDFKDRFLCIDIDNLAGLKDEYGHTAGDDAILAVANSLKNTYQDKRIYRYGGDEFVVWITDSNIKSFTIDKKFIDEYCDIKTKYSELNIDLIKAKNPFRTLHWIMNQIDLGMIKASVNGSKLNCGDPPTS